MIRSLHCILLICASLAAFGQPPLLERRISLEAENQPVGIALQRISHAGGFTFSYNPSIVNADRMVTYNFVDKSIREVLDEIFQGAVRYKPRGKYIILTAGEKKPVGKAAGVVTGYVVDEATGERLRDVSVYDPITLSSTITDEYGYFEIKVDRPPADLFLAVKRRNYADTVVVVPSRHRLQNIPIRIDKEKVGVIADSLENKVTRFWTRQALWFKRVNLFNIDDTITRAGQVSLVPFVGTNHKLSAHVINDYSLNILGGYSLGVRKLEVGGLINLVRADMRGVQFAGLMNGVGGAMRGVQFAGLLNGIKGMSYGVQFAGALNLNARESEGILFAGIGNIAAGRQHGTKVAGVFNLSARESGPFQAAGVFNLSAKEVRGFQGAGVFNFAGKSMNGAQVASVLNFTAKQLKGVQIAGVLNYAGRVEGSQIGLINIADTVNGVPIGLMSLVWKGYHKIEISADEVFYNNVSFRTGVRQFYNIFTVGAKPSTYGEDQTLWAFGYGVGTARLVSRKLFLNLDLTSNQIVSGYRIESLDLLNKLYVGFDYQAFRKMSLTFGATLNSHVKENSLDPAQSIFGDYQPNVFYSRGIGSDHNMKMWIGGKVGLRFL